MSTPSSLRLWASLIALALLLFSGWQVFAGVTRVQSAKAQIDRLQNRPTKQNRISPEQWVISAGSHGAAGAQLQARLRAQARSSDVSLTRVEVQTPDQSAPTLVRATAQANGQPKAMAKFIYQLESQNPALVLERA